MNKEEIKFIEGYEDLLNKGYCDCNEMNCLGYNSPKEILRIVKKLQQENKELSKMCELYSKSLYNADLTKAKQKLEEKEKIIEDAIECWHNYNVFDSFSFPLMKKWEENQVKSSIEYELNETLGKQLLSILEKK